MSKRRERMLPWTPSDDQNVPNTILFKFHKDDYDAVMEAVGRIDEDPGKALAAICRDWMGLVEFEEQV